VTVPPGATAEIALATLHQDVGSGDHTFVSVLETPTVHSASTDVS
jgi:hypothetical protein